MPEENPYGGIALSRRIDALEERAVVLENAHNELQYAFEKFKDDCKVPTPKAEYKLPSEDKWQDHGKRGNNGLILYHIPSDTPGICWEYNPLINGRSKVPCDRQINQPKKEKKDGQKETNL